MSEGEEEWPSLGLDLAVKEGDAEVEEGAVIEEELLSEGEEEWPSINPIPHLEISEQGLRSKEHKSMPQKSIADDDSSDSSSLGELRFQDE